MLGVRVSLQTLCTHCVYWLTHTTACPGGYRFTTQPPSQLNCDPVERFISLQCVSGSISDCVTWYWSQSVCDAGINGTAILPGDTSDAYEVSTLGSASNRQISFTVTQSTLGYYWCEISNALNVSLRSSTITPVLQPTTNTSLPLCTGGHVAAIHNSNPECAAVGSPIVYTYTPLPSECVKMTTPTTQNSAGNPTTSIKLTSYTKSPSDDSTIIPMATTTPTFQTPLRMAPLQVIIVSLGVVVLGLLVGMSLIVVVLAVVVTSLWRQHTNLKR